MLASPRSHAASQDAALRVMELVLDAGDKAPLRMLRPHLPALLEALRALVLMATAKKSCQDVRAGQVTI